MTVLVLGIILPVNLNNAKAFFLSSDKVNIVNMEGFFMFRIYLSKDSFMTSNCPIVAEGWLKRGYTVLSIAKSSK
jgi:hypothetical protein